MLIVPSTHFSSDAGGDFLASIVSNMELELDASVSASYGGSGQIFANLVLSPDSGASKAANNFYLGEDGDISADDPTFNTDTFDFDGDDFFQSIGNTSWMDTLGYSDQPFTIIMVLDKGANLAGNQYLFANGDIANGKNHISLEMRVAGTLDLLMASGTNANLLSTSLAVGMSASTTDNLLIMSVDPAGSKVEAWYNSKTPVSNTSLTFDTTNTGVGAGEFRIGSFAGTPSPQAFIPDGDSVKLFAIRNKATTNTEAGLMIDHLESAGRHDTDYTP